MSRTQRRLEIAAAAAVVLAWARTGIRLSAMDPAAAQYLPPADAVFLAAVLAGCLWIGMAAPLCSGLSASPPARTPLRGDRRRHRRERRPPSCSAGPACPRHDRTVAQVTPPLCVAAGDHPGGRGGGGDDRPGGVEQ